MSAESLQEPNEPLTSAEPQGFSPIPGASSAPSMFRTHQSLTYPIVSDDKAIVGLLETLLSRSGLTISEVARRLGINPASIRQYVHGRRPKPSIGWFVRFVEMCGGKVTVELPPRR
jgi:hypothetical protein